MVSEILEGQTDFYDEEITDDDDITEKVYSTREINCSQMSK